jgi:D-glycero-D-manno-heptose 1,7-bisphosphate phosphatase
MHPLPTTVFLDRDGVINRKMPSGAYVERWEQFEFLPGAIEALELLAAARIRAVVVTNQRGVALGRMTMANVDEIHRRMQEELGSKRAECAAVLVCPHEQGTCDCRKPGLGLFRRAQQLIREIDLDRAVVIGDSATDLLPGNQLGCPSFLVGDDVTLAEVLAEHPDLSVAGWAPSLLDVVTRCLGLTPTAVKATREPTGRV